MPFFSIIIPTYNRAGLLKQALESIAQQTFRDFETLVVDDGSTDETAQVAKSAGVNVHFLRQENRGPGAARNLGIQNARGEYITFLDSDDQWLPWTLETYHQIITEKNGPSFLSGVSVPLEERSPAFQKPALKIDCHLNLLAACTDRVPPVGGTPSICLKREHLLRTKGFTPQRINGEDTDLWLRLGDAPGFVRMWSPPVFRQRHHAGNVSHQLKPTVDGARYLMQQEREGAYPGGALCQRRRLRIICGTVRSVSLDCLNHGRPDTGLQLYRASFQWNLRLGNWKYLIGFPFAACRKKQIQPQKSPCASTV